MISEGQCDTENFSNGSKKKKNQLCHRNKLYFKVPMISKLKFFGF